MRPSLWILVLMILAPQSSFGAASIRLSWDQCDPIVVNRAWNGPGSYAIQVSGTGFSGKYTLLGFRSAFSHRVVDAWDFSSPGCQGFTRASVVNAGGGCPVFPGTPFSFEMTAGAMNVGFYFDQAFVADPAQRYGILRFEFDHANSVVGVAGPGECGSVEQPMCVQLFLTSLYAFDEVSHTFPERILLHEQSFLSWQDPTNVLGCPVPMSTPVLAKTWGAIKATYR